MSPSLPYSGVETGRGEQVGGHHPRQVVQAAEVADDRRQRGRHDRLVERRQEHAEHQCGEHRDKGAPGERRVARRGARRMAVEHGESR
jgi:hypothetical protein